MKGIIIGAGVSGLAASIVSGYPIFESKPFPGGLCAIYYMKPYTQKQLKEMPEDEEVYTFGYGGHWIFGRGEKKLGYLRSIAKLIQYRKHSSIYYPEENQFIPYPIQYHLQYLPKEISDKVFQEIFNLQKSNPTTLEEWLNQNFGHTLMDFFFAPFNEVYTAGLYKFISPQDLYKSPVDKRLMKRGLSQKDRPTEYNAYFYYPDSNFDQIISSMAKQCNIFYGKELVLVDVNKKYVKFSDGSIENYDHLISTIPLSRLSEISGISPANEELPYTSVLVINIGGKKGKNYPNHHWIYIPKSKNGFYRIGFYSNINKSFIPKSRREKDDYTAIYIEKSYIAGTHLSQNDIESICANVVSEIIDWQFLDTPEVIDPIWIDVAYTWSKPLDNKVSDEINAFKTKDIYTVGRYGRWEFKGIIDSMQDGFSVGRSLLSINNE